MHAFFEIIGFAKPYPQRRLYFEHRHGALMQCMYTSCLRWTGRGIVHSNALLRRSSWKFWKYIYGFQFVCAKCLLSHPSGFETPSHESREGKPPNSFRTRWNGRLPQAKWRPHLGRRGRNVLYRTWRWRSFGYWDIWRLKRVLTTASKDYPNWKA